MKLRTDAKRDAILDVASAVFMELGYERTSMAEISSRLGGSKATLYGYFPSKEALFLATTSAFGSKYLEAAFEDMAASPASDLELVLQRFGERMLGVICSPDALAVHRMVMAEPGRSDVGRLFYEAGPKRGVNSLAEFLKVAMESGVLREADPVVAAQQFLALIGAEVQHLWFQNKVPKLTRRQTTQFAERAVAVFIGGYGMR